MHGCAWAVYLVPLGAKINPRFNRGKRKSFSMRLSVGKQIPVSWALKGYIALRTMLYTRLRVAVHVMR